MADDDLIEKTKRQIRKLVVEIGELARQEIDAREFYDGFLQRVVSCLAASGGAVWLGDARNLELAHSMNLPDLGRPLQSLRCHVMLLQKTLIAGNGAVVEPHWGEDDGEQPCNPTDWLLVLGVLKADRDPKGVAIREGRILASGLAKIERYPTGIIEIFQRPGAPPTTQHGYLKFVDQVCEIASSYPKNRR